LRSALSQFEALASQLNESRRLAEELQKVMTLRSRITDAPDNVVQPNRLVVREGVLNILGELPVNESIILAESLSDCSSSSDLESSIGWITGSQFYCVLFNDSLLLSREAEDSLVFICLIPILDVNVIDYTPDMPDIRVLQVEASSKMWAVKSEGTSEAVALQPSLVTDEHGVWLSTLQTRTNCTHGREASRQ